MKLLKNLLAFGLIILGGITTTAQNCRDYEKKCPSPPKGFEVSSLSKSFSLAKKKTVYVKLTLYSDRTYFLSVAGKGKLGKIHYRIFENNEERRILYDNAASGFQETKTIEVHSTINIIIEVSAPSFFENNVRECAGLLVGYKET